MKLNITIEIDDAEIARLLGRDTSDAATTTAPISPGMQLEVGGKYLSRRGETVRLAHYDEHDDTFCGEGPFGLWYWVDGTPIGFSPGGPHNLVSRIA